jgi:hypothetical protein
MIAALDGVDLLVFTGGDRRTRRRGAGRNLRRSLLAWYQPRPKAKTIFGKPHQRSNVALFGARAHLGRRRADRNPYLGTCLGSFVIRRVIRLHRQ